MEGDESFQEDYVIWETLNVDNVAAEEEVANFSESSSCGITYNIDDSSENVTDCFSLGLEDGLQPVEYSDNQLQSCQYSQELSQSTGDKYYDNASYTMPEGGVNKTHITNQSNKLKTPTDDMQQKSAPKEWITSSLQEPGRKNDLVSIRTPTGAHCILPVVTVLPVLKLQDGTIKKCAQLLNVSSVKPEYSQLFVSNTAYSIKKSAPSNSAQIAKDTTGSNIKTCAPLLNISSVKDNSAQLVLSNTASCVKTCSPSFATSPLKSNGSQLIIKHTTKSLHRTKQYEHERKTSEKGKTLKKTVSGSFLVENDKDNRANNDGFVQNKVPTVRIVNIDNGKDTKNLHHTFEKLKNVEMVQKPESNKSKVYVLEKGKLVEKSKLSDTKNTFTNNKTILETNKMDENLASKQTCSTSNLVLPYQPLNEIIIPIEIKFQNAKKMQNVPNVSKTVTCLNPSKSNISNSYISDSTVSQSTVSDANFQIKCENIPRNNSISSSKNIVESDILQNAKLVLTKTEETSEYNDDIGTKHDEPTASDCTELIFTSENAQSNDDFGLLNSEDLSNSKDMGSLFEVNVNASTVLNTFDIPATSQKLLPGNIIQGTDTSQLTNTISYAIQEGINSDTDKTIISNLSTKTTNLDKSLTLDTNNVIINSSVKAESSSKATGDDVKVVKTKGQFYIQQKQKHNNDNVIVLTPLTKEMMMPVLPLDRSDPNENNESDILEMEPDDLANICAESTVRTTPAKTETEAERRERVRLAKRALRMDPNYRARESAKSRIRMQKVRNSKEYREKEREKDRKRRSKSRKENALLRNQEKERDKAYQYYKRLQRNIHGAVMPVFLEEEVSCEINEDVVVTATVGEETDDTESSLSL